MAAVVFWALQLFFRGGLLLSSCYIDITCRLDVKTIKIRFLDIRKYFLQETEMFKKTLVAALCLIFSFCLVHHAFPQEPEERNSSLSEERIGVELNTELEKEQEPQFITSDVLTPKDVEPALNFYIRNDVKRKFSGLITNLKLERIYGILQEDKTASVYFDYSYTSLRNTESVLYEKGKMTFMKFNSGRWFNAELSIFLMDSYPIVTIKEEQKKEE